MKGILINSCSGAGIDSLPSSSLTSLLYNVPGAIESEKTIRETKELIEASNAKIIIQDSGGFQVYVRRRDGQPCVYVEDEAVYYKNALNLTPKNVIKSAEIFHPHIMMSIDNPIPEEKDPAKRHLVFLEHHGFNVRLTKEIAHLKKERGVASELFVPVQAYTLEECDMFLEDLGDTEYDGLSLPKRNHDPIEMAVFFLKFYHAGVRKAHLLGSTTFSRVAILAYFAHHFMDFISMDTTTWRTDGELSKWYIPFNFRDIRLLSDDRIDERLQNECECPWCRGKSLTQIKNMAYSGQSNLLARHNYWCVEQAMREFQKNAASAKDLAEFLLQKTPKDFYEATRRKEIMEIYRCLSNIELIKDSLSNDSIRDLHEYLCSTPSEID